MSNLPVSTRDTLNRHRLLDLSVADDYHNVVVALGVRTSLERASALWELNRMTEAADAYERLWEERQDPRALGPLCRLLGELEEDERLDRILAQAETSDIPAGVVLRFRGSVSADRGRLDEAQQLFREAIDEGDVPSVAELGWLKANGNELAEGRALLESAWALGAHKAGAWLARVLRNSQLPDEAMRWALLALGAGDADALVVIGELLAEAGDVEVAQACFEDAVLAAATDSVTALSLFLVEVGRWRAAADLAGSVLHEGRDNYDALLDSLRGNAGEEAVRVAQGVAELGE